MVGGTGQKRGGGVRRVVGLVVAIALLGLGWSAAWTWAAGALEERFAGASRQIAQRGGSLDCPGREIRGFPFRIGVFCNRFAYASPGGGAIEAGALRSAAQLYAPGRLVGELDGPAIVALPDLGRHELAWEAARISGRAGLSGLQAFSLQLREPRLAAASDLPLGAASQAQFHLRRNPDAPADLDVAFSGDGVEPARGEIAAFSLSGDLRLTGLAGELRPGFDLAAHVRENGLQGEARSLTLSPAAGGRLELSGPISIDPNGVVDADAELVASEPALLAEFFAAAFPDRREEIEAGARLLAGLFPAAGENAGTASVRITIRRGRIVFGLIPLGELPPLW